MLRFRSVKQISCMHWLMTWSYAKMEGAFLICRMLTRGWTSPLTSPAHLTLCRNGALPIFHPEFGRFMLEATPGRPWGIGFKDLLDVEPNMKLR